MIIQIEKELIGFIHKAIRIINCRLSITRIDSARDIKYDPMSFLSEAYTSTHVSDLVK